MYLLKEVYPWVRGKFAGNCLNFKKNSQYLLRRQTQRTRAIRRRSGNMNIQDTQLGTAASEIKIFFLISTNLGLIIFFFSPNFDQNKVFPCPSQSSILFCTLHYDFKTEKALKFKYIQGLTLSVPVSYQQPPSPYITHVYKI